jgi:competence protein ComFC
VIFIFEMMLKLIFPPKCIFCSCLLAIKENLEICDKCKGEIPFTVSVPTLETKYCECVIFATEYTGIVRKAILEFKFKKKSAHFRTFGNLLSLRILSLYNQSDFDFIIAVPLHKSRQLERGYNQAELIAKEISRLTGIKHEPRLLNRFKKTKFQSELKKQLRLANIENAFYVKRHTHIKGKSILLIDDIMTTGATIDECAKVLLCAGARRVVGAVIATGRKSISIKQNF